MKKVSGQFSTSNFFTCFEGCRVWFAGYGAWFVGFGVWNAGYSAQFNMTKHENDIFVSMNHDSMSKTKALLTSLKF